MIEQIREPLWEEFLEYINELSAIKTDDSFNEVLKLRYKWIAKLSDNKITESTLSKMTRKEVMELFNYLTQLMGYSTEGDSKK